MSPNRTAGDKICGTAFTDGFSSLYDVADVVLTVGDVADMFHSRCHGVMSQARLLEGGLYTHRPQRRSRKTPLKALNGFLT